MSTALSLPSLRTRRDSPLIGSMRAPASVSLPIIAPRCFGLQLATQRSPPVIAPAMRKVPASMRSGLMPVAGPVQPFDSLHADGGGACAFHLRTHGR